MANGRKRKMKQPKSGLRKNRRSVVAISFVILTLGIIVFGCGMSLKEKNDAYLVKEAELQQQIAEEQLRSEEIDELQEFVQTDKYTEMIAKEKLGLAYENEILFKAQK